MHERGGDEEVLLPSLFGKFAGFMLTLAASRSAFILKAYQSCNLIFDYSRQPQPSEYSAL